MKRPEVTERVVKALDRIYSIISASVLEGLDDPRRRNFYGKAGEYRLPSHGIEYRTPSSAVLAHPALVHLHFDLARMVGYDFLSDTPSLAGWQSPDETGVQEIINTCDVKAARKILNQNETIVDCMLRRLYGDTYKMRALKLVYNGAKNVLPCTVADFERVWLLGGGWTYHSAAANCCITTMFP